MVSATKSHCVCGLVIKGLESGAMAIWVIVAFMPDVAISQTLFAESIASPTRDCIVLVRIASCAMASPWRVLKPIRVIA